MNKNSYRTIYIRDDNPFFAMAFRMSSCGGIVAEHRLVMARKLGRPLHRKELVHHKDGNRLNNEEGNLQLVDDKEHFKLGVIPSITKRLAYHRKEVARLERLLEGKYIKIHI